MARTSAMPSALSEVENTMNRINMHPGVQGLFVTMADESSGEYGALKTRVLFRDEESDVAMKRDQYSACCTALATQAKTATRDLDPTDELKFIRIRTKKVEIMIAPEKDYTLFCVQDPNAKA
ncbi:MAG: putative dynein light chain roadblock-type 2 [Streblomastix strix]|uniref:Putative dynein light chain roadblock-type 2 n=1 Tax=Streblomastix strix TaxID=222440 RepID=A0A5J4VD10_9EUKA|nr:MAG: putative dynein light chain roadblock-type 2 [Streblomastix strix]